MTKASRVYVAGHRGLIGSAVMRRLLASGYDDVVTRTHDALELTDGAAVDRFFDEVRPQFVVLAAGRVGGIVDNLTYPADFITTNLAIQLNVLQAAHRSGVQKLVLFASSCMYPRECPQPMAEWALFSGHPEPTSMAYAVAKMAGMHMCLAYNRQYGEKRFLPVIPNSVFGPNDNFDQSGHVLSALLRRFHAAKQSGAPSVALWGSGNPRREFVFADDVADACLALLEGASASLEYPLNIGSGHDYSIRELAETIAAVVGYTGRIEWDTTKPDGAPRKLLDSGRLLGFGWRPQVEFQAGLRTTYQWFLENVAETEEHA